MIIQFDFQNIGFNPDSIAPIVIISLVVVAAIAIAITITTNEDRQA